MLAEYQHCLSSWNRVLIDKMENFFVIRKDPNCYPWDCPLPSFPSQGPFMLQGRDICNLCLGLAPKDSARHTDDWHTGEKLPMWCRWVDEKLTLSSLMAKFFGAFIFQDLPEKAEPSPRQSKCVTKFCFPLCVKWKWFMTGSKRFLSVFLCGRFCHGPLHTQTYSANCDNCTDNPRMPHSLLILACPQNVAEGHFLDTYYKYMKMQGMWNYVFQMASSSSCM